MKDTEDKGWWVKYGAQNEFKFVERLCPLIPLDAEINPEKEISPFVPDLVVNGKLADLKYQTTPFFKAGEFYGIPPEYAVTFNHKDFSRYTRLYPQIVIYFWVNWMKTALEINGAVYSVTRIYGVWEAPLSRIREIIENNGVGSHEYQKRRGDTMGNAKSSYVFDVRWFKEIYRYGLRR